MENLRKAFADRLGTRLVVLVFSISTALSLLSTAVQLGLSFQRGAQSTFEVADRVGATIVEPLQKALWQLNIPQVEVILQGVQSDPVVARVVLVSDTNQRFEYGDTTFDENPADFVLVQPRNRGEGEIGRLTVFLSLESTWQSVWAQFWTLLATNLIKAYLVALAILLVFFQLVARHLTDIASSVDTVVDGSEPLNLSLDRPSRPTPDGLDKIVEALNALSRRVAVQVDTLQNEVEHRRLAEAKVRAAYEARNRFVANMSHETRTPLNAMMGLFQLIEASDAPDRQKKQASMGLAAAHQLLSLLSNVLELSRLEANAIELYSTEQNLRDLVEEWGAAAEGAIARYGKEISVVVDVDPALPECVVWDEKRVTQVVHNLCDNAAKFTKEGQIHIAIKATSRSTPGPDMVRIAVSDTGMGIAQDELDTVFERFHQVDNSLTREQGGTGLGLSICADLAELMGGTLSVQSPPALQGFATTFTLTLPTDITVNEAV